MDSSLVIGFEEGCSPASDRARVAPVVAGLAMLGLPVRRVGPKDDVWVRVVNRVEPSRIWGWERHRILNVSDNLLFPPSRGIMRDLDFAWRIRPKLRRAISMFDAVVAGSPLQVRAFGDLRPCVAIPDVAIYLAEHARVEAKRASPDKLLTFVWDGQGANFPYVEALLRTCQSFFRRSDVCIRVVTDERDPVRGRDNRASLAALRVNSEFVPWHPQRFMADVGIGHVGLAPVDGKCRFARAKPDNKAVNYLSLGMPVICTSTPAYDALADKTSAVWSCSTPVQWQAALEEIASRRHQLREIAEMGHAHVLKHYALDAIAKQWAEFLVQFIPSRREV